ncbi:MAG: AraC family transcriptional regulator [Parvibaculum sp.]
MSEDGARGSRDVHMDGVEFFRTFAGQSERRVLEPGNFSYCALLQRGNLNIEVDYPRNTRIRLQERDVIAVSGLAHHSFSSGNRCGAAKSFARCDMPERRPDVAAELIIGVVPNEALALGSLMVGPILIRPGEHSDLSRQVWQAAEMLETEYASGDTLDRTLVVRRLAEIMLINMTRRLMRDRVDETPRRAGSGTEKQIMQALDIFFEMPNKRWDLVALSRAAGMSRTRFAETFKAVTGQTPARVLNRLRLATVARRMAAEDLPVEAAAEAAGYRSAAAFVRAFQREHGETPARWRRRSRGDENPS